MIKLEDIKKKIDSITDLLPLVESVSTKSSQTELLEIANTLYFAIEKQEVPDQNLLSKLERGCNAMLKTVLLQIDHEKTLSPKDLI